VAEKNAMQLFNIKFGLNEDKGDSFGIRFSEEIVYGRDLNKLTINPQDNVNI
jgi:hypothetical protein